MIYNNFQRVMLDCSVIIVKLGYIQAKDNSYISLHHILY